MPAVRCQTCSLPPWASRSSPAPRASSARTSRACSSSAATACASTVRTGSIARPDRRTSTSRRCAATSSTAARCGARCAASTRVFHVAGLTSLRAGADALFRVNVDGTRIVLEEALRAGVERVVHTSSVAAIGPAPRGSTADERQVVPRRRATACRTSTASTRPRARRCASPRTGLPVVIVNPAHVLGARRRLPLLDGARAALPAPPDPGLRRRRAERRRRRATSPRGHLLADERGAPGERYILGNRNFTLDRLFADLGAPQRRRAAGGEAAARRRAAARRGRRAPARHAR